jgi:hypothetical protein
VIPRARRLIDLGVKLRRKGKRELPTALLADESEADSEEREADA